MQGHCFVDVRDVRCPVETCRERSSEVVKRIGMMGMGNRSQTECFTLCSNSIIQVIDVACLAESRVKGSAEVSETAGTMEVGDRLQSECCSK